MAPVRSSVRCNRTAWDCKGMQKILIIGATSAIAEATARLFARRGDRLYLLARNAERLESLSRDLKIRGAGSVMFDTLDVNEFEGHQAALDSAIEALGGIDIVLIVHGTLPDQKACEASFALSLEELTTNAISTISLLTLLANHFEQKAQGTIATVASVAGDRGRCSNYVYGTAKGSVAIFLQGLRARLYGAGVHVLTIKPGFVETPMTSDFEKGFLWSKPDRIARGIVRGIDRKKDVIYVPPYWRLIMFVIKAVPESIFKRLTL